MNKQRILITGAAGTIGRALVQHYLLQDQIVCAFDNSEDGLFRLGRDLHSTYGYNQLKLFVGDIRDRQRLLYACDSVDVVIHAAALKHVELSEYNVMDCIETNVNGTRNIVYAAIESGVKKVLFTSSDKAVNPTSTMGATKLLGERVILDANYLSGSRDTKFTSVRFGNVLDSNGSVLTIFRNKKDSSEVYPITDLNMTRFFLSISDAVNLVSKAIEEMQGGEIFIKSMGAASIYTLAQAVAGKENINYKIIGVKPGEKLYEELVTEPESKRCICSDGLYIIQPEISIDYSSNNLPGSLSGAPKINGALTSINTDLDWKELARIIEKVV